METKQLRYLGLFLVVFMFFVHFAFAQVNMTATGSYTQNFNSLSQSGSSNSFSNNTTISSWYIQRENSNANPNSYAADNGGSSSGRFYSYGSNGSSERALGILNSGSTDDAAIGLLLRNTSGVTITNITVSYTLEQWRKGSDGTQGVAFRYRTSSSSFSDLNENSDFGWTSVSALDLDGPVSSGSDNISLNGNSASNSVSVSNVSLSGLSLANGDYIMLRWRDINHSGSDNGFGIDDVTVNFTVPSVIFSNEITTNNNSANPYTTNQVVDVNASAEGIGRGDGLNYESENGGYAANNYTTSSSLDSDDYMYFTITPNVGYQLNFESFDYQEERTDSDGPEDFSFRSSLNYGLSILTYTLTNESPNNRSIDLGASQYQNVQSTITFRLYGWDAPGGSSNDREYSINSFAFLGTVTMIPPTVSNTTPTSICDNGSGLVTVTGNNLIHVTNVTVGGTPVSIDSQTNSELVVTVPQGVFGILTVTNEAGSANGATIELLNAVTYYADLDADGFGDAASFVSNCTGQPVGYVANSLDCDDNLVLYEDLDNDGFGSLVLVACGGVTNNLDTNDNLLTYVDADNDGFGSSTLAPSGVTNNTDCDDTNNTVYPGATEICYDGLDNDCDGTIDNGCTPIVSVVQPAQCGQTLATIDSYVYANLVAGAQGYRFRVTDMTTNEVQSIDRALRVFRLTQLTNYAFNRTYTVEVSVRINNVWQPFYGTPCNVSTPDTTTQVQASQCNTVISNVNNAIFADIVPFATGYRFRVTNTLNPIDVQTIDRPIRDFRMNLLSNIQFNTTYNVEVAVRNTDGEYLSYGPVCNITTPLFPTVGLEDAQCDEYMVTSNTEVLYAESYPGVEQYRFLLENVSLAYSQAVDRATRTFSLSNFTGLLPGEMYTVRVAIRLNGVWGPYGKSCSVIAPGGEIIVIRPGDSMGGTEFKAIAYPNPFETSFTIDVRTSNTEAVSLTVYDMAGRLLEVKEVKAQDVTNYQFGEGYPSGVYNLVVTQGNETRTVRVVKQ
ncbi:T9SS type A sorting domain-containing protein [Flavobacterium sp.]|uniref:T9SS type A sorting domain-containing protein n=1 Tax=Flavobacterium sp. TaxID=239 RepID=UPI003526E1E0